MGLELYDVMGEDMYIAAYLHDDGYSIETVVTDGDDNEVFREVSAPAAWDSLVYFAKQVLSEDCKIEIHKKIKGV